MSTRGVSFRKDRSRRDGNLGRARVQPLEDLVVATEGGGGHLVALEGAALGDDPLENVLGAVREYEGRGREKDLVAVDGSLLGSRTPVRVAGLKEVVDRAKGARLDGSGEWSEADGEGEGVGGVEDGGHLMLVGAQPLQELNGA